MFGLFKSVLKLVTGEEKLVAEEENRSCVTSKKLSGASEECIIEKLVEEVLAIEGCEDHKRDIAEVNNVNSIKENDIQPDFQKPNEIITNNNEEAKQKSDHESNTLTCEGGWELCQHRTGIVTKLCDEYGVIDELFHFDNKQLKLIDLQQGASVSYVVFRTNVNDKWKLHKVLSSTNENWEDHQEESKVKIIKKTGCINRKIIGQVETKRSQEIFVKPNIKLSLNHVKLSFIPQKGDWLSINALVELDESVQDFVGDILTVYDIQPLRSRIISGYITHWDGNLGVVDSNVWFTQEDCEPGLSPTLGDEVVVEAIESTQGTCSWRALSVGSLTEMKEKSRRNDFNLVKEENQSKQKEASPWYRNGICVPKKVEIGCINIGESKEHSIEISNLEKSDHLLLRVRIHGKRSESQVILLSNSDGTVIGSGEKKSCFFRVSGKFFGQFSETLVFTFKGFRIPCFINFEIQDQYMKGLIGSNKPYRGNFCSLYSKARSRVEDKNKFFFKGEKLLKPPSFIPVKFNHYNVPEDLWKAVLGESDIDCIGHATVVSRLGKVVSCLKRDLSACNYVDRFHALLYLEEIELNVQIRKFDMQNITLSFVGDGYLSLEIPGLAERRLCLLIGDKINLESSKHPGVYEGYVHKVLANEVWLKFHSQFHRVYESEECSVRFIPSNSSVQRCHVAVDLAMKNLGEEILFPTRIIVKEPQVNLVEEDNYNHTSYKYQSGKHVPENRRNKKNSNNKLKFSKDGVPIYKETGKQFLPVPPPPRISKIPLNVKWFNRKLNSYQKSAVLNALKGEARPLPYVIFGPPGTGKTMTLVETILQIYSLIPDSRILIATPSNSAANLVAERLLVSNLLCPGDLVRLVAWHYLEDGSIPEVLLPYSTSCDISAYTPGESSRITYKLKKSSNASVLGRHRITVGTCVALGQLYTMGFPSGHFTHVCVDEAGQATEPELLIPLGFLHKDWGQAIFAGDPLQLGPVVISSLCEHFGLGYSFLARLLDSPPYERNLSVSAQNSGYNSLLVTRLVMNYRSLPEILELPSSLFYDSQLQSQIDETGQEGLIVRSLAKFLPERDSNVPPSIVFHGVRGHNFQDSDCPSWFNPKELMQIIYYLKDFYDSGLTIDDVGVITPYQKQVQKLRSLLNQLNLPSPKIGSVEEFQGQERQVILLSTVRSSSKFISLDVRYTLGFVASPQRLNVALTRARALLIIIGNPHLLACDPHWKRTLSYCIDKNAYVGCDLPRDFLDNSLDEFPTNSVQQE